LAAGFGHGAFMQSCAQQTKFISMIAARRASAAEMPNDKTVFHLSGKAVLSSNMVRRGQIAASRTHLFIFMQDSGDKKPVPAPTLFYSLVEENLEESKQIRV